MLIVGGLPDRAEASGGPWYVEGGTFVRDGAVIGAWFLDRHGLVLAHRPNGDGTLVLAWRDGARAMGTSRAVPPEAGAPTVDDLPRVVDGDDPSSMQSALVRMGIATAPAATGEAAPYLDHVVRGIMTNVMHVGTVASVREVAAQVLAERDAAHLAVQAFARTLDHHALPFVLPLARLRKNDPLIYAAMDRTFDPGAPLARAWTWSPFLRGEALLLWDADEAGLRRAVSEGRDAYAGLVRADVAARSPFGRREGDLAVRIAEAAPSWPTDLQEALLPCVTHRAVDAALDVARVVATLPTSWHPRDEAGWRSLSRVVSAVDWCVERAAPEDVATLVNAKGDLDGLADRLAATHGRGASTAALRRALRDVLDVLDGYGNEVVAPAVALARHGADPVDLMVLRAVATRALCSGRTLRRVLETSRRWHVGLAAMRAAMPPSDAWSGSWPAVLPDAVVDGFDVRVLTTREALRTEGSGHDDADGVRGLAHCVGGYANRCLRGGSRILSLRRDGPERPVRTSTAELTWRGGRAAVAQHRGAGNAAPGEMDVAALAAYVAGLNAGTFATTASDLPRIVPDDPVTRACGYDWRAAGAWERVRDLWDAFLPRASRGAPMAAVAGLLGDGAELHGPWLARAWRPTSADAGDVGTIGVTDDGGSGLREAT